MNNLNIITVSDVLDYLGIDYADEMINRNVERCINTAGAYLKGAIGDNLPVDDPRVKELALIVTSDFYENRGLLASGTPANNTRRLVNDLEWQLRLELRRAQNA